MKEYIERETILQYAEKMYALAKKRVIEANTESDVWKATHETQMNERKEFVDLLQNAPAADVAEVVRCQDCKNLCVGGVWFGDARWGCKILEVSVDLDFFCGFGERKEDKHEAG